MYIGWKEVILDKEREYRYGKMGQYMKVGGKTTKLMAKED